MAPEIFFNATMHTKYTTGFLSVEKHVQWQKQAPNFLLEDSIISLIVFLSSIHLGSIS